jgi:hypothetical protein
MEPIVSKGTWRIAWYRIVRSFFSQGTKKWLNIKVASGALFLYFDVIVSDFNKTSI